MWEIVSCSKNNARKGKLSPKLGPYEVIELRANENVTLQKRSKKKRKTVHKNLIRVFVDGML